MDPAFKGAGANEGLELWRIEDFKPVKMSEVGIPLSSLLIICTIDQWSIL